MLRKKIRRWHRDGSEDPMAGMLNLFDLWIVVVVVLVLALLGTMAHLDQAYAQLESQNQSGEQLPTEQLNQLPKFRRSDSQLSGQGERLGSAYRLQSGEVVYVPDS